MKEVEGYSGQVGNVCTATVGNSDLHGGAINFEIANAEKLLVEKSRVESALQPCLDAATCALKVGD